MIYSGQDGARDASSVTGFSLGKTTLGGGAYGMGVGPPTVGFALTHAWDGPAIDHLKLQNYQIR